MTLTIDRDTTFVEQAVRAGAFDAAQRTQALRGRVEAGRVADKAVRDFTSTRAGLDPSGLRAEDMRLSEIAVSDRTTLRDVSQFLATQPAAWQQAPGKKQDGRSNVREGRFEIS
jgi:hypothetical protein